MSHFVYLPPEDGNNGVWVNLSLICQAIDSPGGDLDLYNQDDVLIGCFSGKRAEVLRAVLSESYERRLFEILLSAQDIEFGSTAQAINACRTAAIQAARVKFS